MADKVLVVEDDPAALRLVTYTLESAGYDVVSATNGLEGLALASQERPAVIVLDVMLPGMDGFEVCHRLRAGPGAGVPILMMSAKGQETDKQAGQRVGADLYLVKPAEPDAIISAVQRLAATRNAA